VEAARGAERREKESVLITAYRDQLMFARPWTRLALLRALWFISTLLLLAHEAHAQDLGSRTFLFSEPEFEEAEEPDEIETDRDSFTPATRNVASGRIIVESAWSFVDQRRVAETHSLPELIARIGLNDWLELRLGWNYEVGGAASAVSGNASNFEESLAGELERDSQLSYGLKAALTSQRGFRPRTALIVQGGTPTSGKDPASQVVTSFVAGWTLPNDWKWDTALRYGFDSAEGDHFNIWAPSTVLRIPLAESWATHGEFFSVISQGQAHDRAQHYFSTGLHYLVNSDLEVGFRVGWGLNQDAANFFSNVGFGWRY